MCYLIFSDNQTIYINEGRLNQQGENYKGIKQFFGGLLMFMQSRVFLILILFDLL